MPTPLKRPERPRALIREVECIHHCGFKRPFTDADWWLKRIIDHPVWGLQANEQVVELDVYYHDCNWFTERRARAREIFQAKAHRR